MIEFEQDIADEPGRFPDLIVPISVTAVTHSGGLPPLDLSPRPVDARRAIERCNLTLHPEMVLTDMLQECHYIMREVAMRTAGQSSDAQDRLAFIRSAMHCAETGANVAKAMAKLRALPMDEDRADAVTVEMAKLAEAPDKPESEKQ